MHIAQLNVSNARYDLDDPHMADFVNNLDRVNAVADRSKGFVWRMKAEGEGAKLIRASDDPRFIVNLSVWETVEDLERFVFATVHKKIYDRRAEWFPKMATPSFVMWPVAVGHRPTTDEALARLDLLTRGGPSDEAFGWERLADLKLWMQKRCA